MLTLPNEVLETIASQLGATPARQPLAHRVLDADGVLRRAAPAACNGRDLRALRSTCSQLRDVVDAGWPQLVPDAVAQNAANGHLDVGELAPPHGTHLEHLLARAQAVTVPAQPRGSLMELRRARSDADADVALTARLRIPQMPAATPAFLPRMTALRHLWSDADLLAHGQDFVHCFPPGSLRYLCLTVQDDITGLPPSFANVLAAQQLINLQLKTSMLLEEDWIDLLEALPASLHSLCVTQDLYDPDWEQTHNLVPARLQLRKLEQLTLSTYNLAPQALRSVLAAAPQLHALTLDCAYDLSTSGALLADCLPPSVRRLGLNGLSLDAEADAAIFGAAANNVQTLALSSMTFTQACARAFSARAMLVSLSFVDTIFARDSLALLAANLPVSLRILHLRDNRFASPHQLPSLLTNLPDGLQSLRLDQTNIAHTLLLPPSLRWPKALRQLTFLSAPADDQLLFRVVGQTRSPLRRLSYDEQQLPWAQREKLKRCYPQLLLAPLSGARLSEEG